jgi:uncharacterized protein YjbJ (UPF0337 family)
MRRQSRRSFNAGDAQMGINKDQVEGRAKEAGGKVQEEFGKLTGNDAQRAKGLAKQAVGAGQAAAGDMSEKAKKVAKDLSKNR